MRFMALVKSNPDSEAGKMPSEQALVEMGKFNEELIKAGILLAGEGLHPTSKGVRLNFSKGSKPTITDGPFAETKELLGGFWMVQVKSKEEAIEWFSRCPSEVGEIELRQVFDVADFEPAIQTEAGRATLEAEEAFRKQSQMGGSAN